jgi:hypothetical protein
MLHKHARRALGGDLTSPVWDYVASVAGRLPLASNGTAVEGLGPGSVRCGDALLVRVVTPNPSYDALELSSGQTAPLRPGSVFVGVAGARQALRGFAGEAPGRVALGEKLSLLNLGGVIGRASGGLLDLGEPTVVELVNRLGRAGRPLNLAQGAIRASAELPPGCPIVAVVGTSMSAGKTRAAVELVAGAAAAGLRVAAVKLTGVACLRDVLRMRERGAGEAISFLDSGLPSTVGQPALAGYARGLVRFLDRQSPEVIVAELGDGILGPYGVDQLLRDPALVARIKGVILSASDHVGAWGAVQLLAAWGLRVDLVTGPVTDSPAARAFLAELLGVPAVNACTEGARLFPATWQALASRRSERATAPVAVSVPALR